MNRNSNTTLTAVQVILGIYVVTSVVEGAFLSAQGFPTPFVGAFAWNALCLASLYWLHKNP